MADHDELIAQFIEISGGDENVARFYLSSSNWSLEDALSHFLGNQGDGDGDNNSDSASGQADEAPATGTSDAKSGSSSGGGSFGRQSAKPRFATLGDMSKRSGGNQDDEEGQAFYAGGSDRSGQQVLGPPKRKNFREQLTDMFRMAQESSANVENSPAPSTSSGASWGQGIRLGMTDNDHSVVTPANKDGEQKTKPVVVLKLWSQGFSIDDGELRLYDDPQNKEFLETVMRGEIPNELLEMGWMVNVDVEDHRHEDYKKKPTTVKTFKGAGHSLGSPTPNVTAEDAPTATTTASTSDAKSNDEAAKEKLKLDNSAPVTTIQVRLADGTRLAGQFNLTHTVGNIQEYIQTARPQYADRNFILVSSFPTRELTDLTATIDSAGLKNASLMQRLK